MGKKSTVYREARKVVSGGSKEIGQALGQALLGITVVGIAVLGEIIKNKLKK